MDIEAMPMKPTKCDCFGKIVLSVFTVSLLELLWIGDFNTYVMQERVWVKDSPGIAERIAWSIGISIIAAVIAGMANLAIFKFKKTKP
jgi:hypothetical protein